MKILRITIENLNSLSGKWEIDLTHPDYRDGLFLISGETGAGKTTILDAITLAFFGRTARLDISCDHDEVMTHGEKSCSAEVEFSCEERDETGRMAVAVYRAGWSHARARENSQNPYSQAKRTLAKLDGGKWVEMSGTPTQLERRTAKLIGVSGEKKEDWFEQYLRTSMLAQGKFDQFLRTDGKNSDKQRSQILEQATGTAIYSRIGREINERKKSAEREVSDLEAQKRGAASATKSDEVVAGLKEKLAADMKSRDELTARVAELELEARWHSDAAALADERARLARCGEAISARKASSAAVLARADRADAARKLQPEYAELSRAEQEAKSAVARADRCRAELVRAQETEKTAIRAVEASAVAVKAAESECTARGPTIAQAIDLDGRIRTGREALRTLEVERDTAVFAVGSAAETIAQGEKYIAVQLSAAEEAKKARSEEPAEIAERASAVSSGEHDLAAKLAQRDRMEAEYRNRIEDLVLAVQLAEDDLREASRVADYEEARSHLEDGLACPLCGSRDHPFCHGLVRTPDAYLDRLRVAQAKRDDLVHRLESARSEYSGADRALSQARSCLEEVRQAWQAKAQLLALEENACRVRAKERGDLVSAAKTKLPDLKKTADGATAAYETARAGIGTLIERRTSCGLEGDPVELRDSLQRKLESARQKASADAAALAGAKSACAGKSENLATASREVETARLHLKAGVEAFLKRCDALGYPDAETWKRACWTDAELAAAERERTEIQDSETELKALRGSLDAKEVEFAKRKSSDREPEIVAADLSAAGEALKTVSEAVAVTTTILKEDEEDRRNVEKLAVKIRAKSEALARWREMDRELGGENGSNFKLYAQGITLARLVELGNKYLYPMSNKRYEMIWDSDGVEAARLLPAVVDRKARNEKRPIVNLSGGEKFQVSLALALGLSELNSGTLNVETLFLDEGFGTLDEKTLDLSIQTLEGVQRDAAKTIGIISHVHELEVRPMTKIVATKRGNGVSELAGPGVRKVGL